MATNRKMTFCGTLDHHDLIENATNPDAVESALKAMMPEIVDHTNSDWSATGDKPIDYEFWSPPPRDAWEGTRHGIMSFTCNGIVGKRLIQLVKLALLGEVSRIEVTGANRVALLRETRKTWEALEQAAGTRGFTRLSVVVKSMHGASGRKQTRLEHPEDSMGVTTEGSTFSVALKDQEPPNKLQVTYGLDEDASRRIRTALENHFREVAIELGRVFRKP